MTVVVIDQNGIRTWFSYLPSVNDFLKEVSLDLFLNASFIYIDAHSYLLRSAGRAVAYAKLLQLPILVNFGFNDLIMRAINEGTVDLSSTAFERELMRLINSAGAGAAFSASLLCGFRMAWQLVQSLKFVVALGSLYCTARESIRKVTVESVQKFKAQFMENAIDHSNCA